MTSEGALFESVIGVDEEGGSGKKSVTDSPASTDGSEETEPEPEEELYEEEEIGIKVVTQPGDAQIFINNEFVGTGSVLVTPQPGTYQITVRRSGYYAETVWTQYDENTLIFVPIDLDEITGYLYVEMEPPGSIADASGRPISEGVTELQIGTYSLRVRKFGYEEWRGEGTILEKSTTRVSVSLEEAKFEIRDLGSSRNVFNPSNPGKLGTVRISFEVTSWGDGIFVVTDAGGNELYSRPLPVFTDWDQELEWDGKDNGGRRLDDGIYRIRIKGRGKKAGETSDLERDITIDSSAVISYRSVMSGISGTLFSPLPQVLPEGSFQINAGIIGHYSLRLGVGRYPTFAAVRASLGERGELNLHGAIFVGPEDPMPYTAGVGYKYAFSESELLAFAATGKLTYVANTSIDTLHNYTGLSVGVVSALMTKPLILTLSPEIVFSPYSVIYPKSNQSESFHVWGYGRAGILADFGSLTAGISLSVRTYPFNIGFGLQPPYSAGAEVHWLIPGTQIVISGYLATEFDAVNYFYMMGGAGVGFIN
jgi:hypothetical protein